MIPELIKIGPIPIHSFGLMIALALFAGILRLQKSFQVNGINPAYADSIVFVTIFAGLIGARLWYIGENLRSLEGRYLEAIFSGSGFTFYGGFIVGFATILIMGRRYKLKLSSLLDSAGPTLALCYAIGRLGCQLSGDGDYGIATDSIWGMSYSTGVVPTPPGVLAYPTPLYESVASLLIMFILLKIETLPGFRRPFLRIGICVNLFSIERFLVEFIRINDRIAWGLSEAQIISIALFAISLCVIFWKKPLCCEGET
ncbi:MAG: prolipoprotein diacylglyceryl transferase [Candidatus Dadabacteria bacterium]|nr:MAG: prolipoprotein diacylglyceryl transferase [Candidatus Dadabacteria bacterium]